MYIKYANTVWIEKQLKSYKTPMYKVDSQKSLTVVRGFKSHIDNFFLSVYSSVDINFWTQLVRSRHETKSGSGRTET